MGWVLHIFLKGMEISRTWHMEMGRSRARKNRLKAENRFRLMDLGTTEQWLSRGDSERVHVTPWTVTSQASLSMEFSRQEYWSGSPSPGDLPDPGVEPGSPEFQADTLPSELLPHAWGLSFNVGRRKLASTMTSEVKDCTGFSQCLWEQAYLSIILVSHFSALHFPLVMFKPSVKLCCYSLALDCLKSKVRICVKLFWGNRLFLSLVQLHQSSSIDWRNVKSSRNAESDQQESEWWSEAEWSSAVWNPAKQGHRCGMTEQENHRRQPFPPTSFWAHERGRHHCGREGLGAHWYSATSGTHRWHLLRPLQWAKQHDWNKHRDTNRERRGCDELGNWDWHSQYRYYV